MKKSLLILFFVIFGFAVKAQDGGYNIRVHGNNSILLNTPVTNIDSIYFFSNTEAEFKTISNLYSFPISSIDSLTFAWMENNSDYVYVTYQEGSAEVENPYSDLGVDVSVDGTEVIVNSTAVQENIIYYLSGTTTSGSFALRSDLPVVIVMDELNLTNPNDAAVTLNSENGITIQLVDGKTSILSDSASSQGDAVLSCSGNITFAEGAGTLQLNSFVGHGVKCDNSLNINAGNIFVSNCAKDGIHLDGGFAINDGSLIIENCNSDGVDCVGNLTVAGGSTNITCTIEDTKALKSDASVIITGGTLEILTSGAQSKGIKSGSDMTISGGDITITASGATVLQEVNGSIEPSYCTAVKADSQISLLGGTLNVTLPTSNNGGKGISSDGIIIIDGATIDIITQGNGATYTVSGSTKDAYSSSCIKAETGLQILSGDITCSSTGSGGKGINTEGTMVIGVEGADNNDLILDVSTSGERITITQGGWGGGGDYSNPKAIKAQGNLTINSGTITIDCQQNNEGGECIESKATLTINGGYIEVYSAYDDAINAASNITINGGQISAKSGHNDGIDSNGTLFIAGGFTVSQGAGSPEEGFDCDNHQFKITGGVGVGVGGATSNPTSNVCTQHSIIVSTSSGYAIQILNSSDEEILTFKCPTISGGGGPGGGGSGVKLLFTDDFPTGSYTIRYNGTISGGEEWHGYYTGATYTGGQETTFNVSGMVTNVNAGGGWRAPAAHE